MWRRAVIAYFAISVCPTARRTAPDRASDRRRSALGDLSFGTRGPAQFDAPWGHTLIAKYAMTARRHMHEFGTKIEELAEIAVSARHNASLNPEAFYREPITIDDVANSGMIADPFTKLHCCIRSDGGGAVVLTSAERARSCKKSPVWVLGTGEAVSHMTMSEWRTSRNRRRNARRISRSTGRLTPSDVDVCELYDAFHLDAAAHGRGARFLQEGRRRPVRRRRKLRVGGALPTNTTAAVSRTATGHARHVLLVEAVRQLRGECGLRQVNDAAIACVNGTGGWFTSASTLLLGRD